MRVISRFWQGRLIGVAALVWLAVVPALSAAEPYHIREIWLDAVRQRHVHVRISFPAPRRVVPNAAALPLFLFSVPQGWRLGGYHDFYEYLTVEMARRGVVMVTVSHYDLLETGGTKEAFAAIYPGILTGNRQDASVDRYEDMRFVIRQLAQIDAEKRPGWPAMDVTSIAVGGHSSGVLTALHLCGLPVRDGTGQFYAVDRDTPVKAFVIFGYPLAYSGPSRADLRQVRAIPGLHVVGTEDRPYYRNTAYRHIQGAPQYWLVAQGDHDLGSSGPLELLQVIVGRFIGAYLLGDPEAVQGLTKDAFPDPQHQIQTFVRKPLTRQWVGDRRDLIAWLLETVPWGAWLHEKSGAYYRANRV